MSLSRMGRLLTSMTCWRMAKASVLSTTRGMGLSARLGLVCHLAIANLLALAHFRHRVWWRACQFGVGPGNQANHGGNNPNPVAGSNRDQLAGRISSHRPFKPSASSRGSRFMNLRRMPQIPCAPVRFGTRHQIACAATHLHH